MKLRGDAGTEAHSHISDLFACGAKVMERFSC